jgi:chemotaxis protein CheD
MCHILLPGRQRPPGSPADGRYADEAVERFALELRIRHITPGDCQIKLFGGARMFTGAATATMNIGQRNIEAARRALDAHGFRVMAEHVGGTARRRLFFNLASGHVWLAAPETRSIP